MTYGELKEKDVYKNADDVILCVNGEEPIDEMYYPFELDHLNVIGTGHSGNILHIDIICENWDDRHEVNWIAK